MSSDWYNFQNAVTVLRNPKRLTGVYYHFANKINRAWCSYKERDSDDFLDEDWDNLLILDACRYDMFEEQVSLEGELQSRRSPASESLSFIQENFVGRELHDTIYITANPYATYIPDQTFFKRRNLLRDKWDENLKTVTPTAVIETVLDEQQKHPNKRIIAHFMQPHIPFIGPTGRRLAHAGLPKNEDGSNVKADDHIHIWHKLQFRLDDDITHESVWEAYNENLDIVIEKIETNLLDNLQGKTVLTSDHANLVGDWIGPVPSRAYGHPRGLLVDKLTKVPWHIIEDSTRPNITSESPIEGREEIDALEDKLEALGYR